jgi:Flp pilus assembly protein TadG
MAVEYAIVLPAVLMFVLAVVDSSRLLFSNTMLAHAVQAAARCGSVNAIACGTTAAIQSYAVNQAWGLGLATSAFTVTTITCGTNVAGTAVFAFIVPWYYIVAPFGVGNTLTLSTTACYPV